MLSLPQGDHQAGGVSYHVEGSGPPLLLLPLVIAPSQWEPILPRLREHFTLITLGSRHVGFVPILEARGQTDYLRVATNVVDAMDVQPGQRLLEAGCGTGVLSRAIARRLNERCPITAIDINAYLLGEAHVLANEAGLAHAIDFQAGSTESLPFHDATFDATMSFTVLEEVNAERALTELVRVTKPGGRVGIAVRAIDRRWHINVNVGDDVRDVVEAPSGPVGPGGCGDASLYRRMSECGLANLKLLPQIAGLTGPMAYYYLDRFGGKLPSERRAEWTASVEHAQANGTLFVGHPFHSAVGTRPV